MAAQSPVLYISNAAALSTIAINLRQCDASACEAAALQLLDMVTAAPVSSQAAFCAAVASAIEVVDAGLVQTLGRAELSSTAQRALMTAMMTIYMKVFDICNEPSSAMTQASPAYLPVVLRIIAQEQPVAACRCTTMLPLHTNPKCRVHALFSNTSFQLQNHAIHRAENTPRPTPPNFPYARRACLFARPSATQTTGHELSR